MKVASCVVVLALVLAVATPCRCFTSSSTCQKLTYALYAHHQHSLKLHIHPLHHYVSTGHAAKSRKLQNYISHDHASLSSYNYTLPNITSTNYTLPQYQLPNITMYNLSKYESIQPFNYSTPSLTASSKTLYQLPASSASSTGTPYSAATAKAAANATTSSYSAPSYNATDAYAAHEAAVAQYLAAWQEYHAHVASYGTCRRLLCCFPIAICFSLLIFTNIHSNICSVFFGKQLHKLLKPNCGFCYVLRQCYRH